MQSTLGAKNGFPMSPHVRAEKNALRPFGVT